MWHSVDVSATLPNTYRNAPARMRREVTRIVAKYNRNSGRDWTPAEVQQMRNLAAQNTPTRVIGLKLGRTEDALRTRASQEGISLKRTNQSPYGSK